MNRRASQFVPWAVTVLLGSVLACTAGCKRLGAQEAPGKQASAAAQPADPGWPRQFTVGEYEVIVHQPQVDSWENYQKATFRAAISVAKKGDKQPTYGVIRATAPTVVDFENRTVTLGTRTFDEVRFIGVTDAEAEPLKKAFMSVLTPERPLTYSLDRALAAVDRGKLQTREAKVNLEPPPIYYSDKPAVLVIFLGAPKFQKVPGTNLLFATNTNWDVFMETGTSRYFLLNGDTWLTTQDVAKGPWAIATALPADLGKLPNDENWQDVRKNIPGKQAGQVPAILVSTLPAELIVTNGKPELEPITGTKILNVKNCEADLFFHGGDSNYYFLAAGRWFRAKELTGPWTAASTDLPADFRDIPEDHECANVLPSVRGTPEAEEAAIQASIPRTATVNRKEVTVKVAYQGDPKFLPIGGTPVQYAVNTPMDVFLVEAKYYCCQQGVWFVADAPGGPWAVCTAVPPALYTIPATHPKYNVTYVYVYNSTPETVTVGYTSGYTGEYIVGGALVFGAALLTAATFDHWMDEWHDHWDYHCHGPAFSYGCGAAYSHYHGGYYRAAAYYGPYGGAGRWAGYNPATGVYSRGAYRYGPNGSAYARAAYNPSTGVAAGAVRVSTPYGSWGRGAVSNGEDWIRGGYASGARGTVAGIETSHGGAAIAGVGTKGGSFVAAKGAEGGAIVAGQRPGGEGTVVAKGPSGDNTYVGHDGNVYRRDESGDWAKYGGSGNWNSVQPPGGTTTPGTGPATQPKASTLPATTPRTTPGTQPKASTLPATTPGTGPATQPKASTLPATTAKTTPKASTQPTPPPRPSPTTFQGSQGSLNRDAYGRQRGEYSAQRAQTTRSAPPARTRSSSGGGGRGRGR